MVTGVRPPATVPTRRAFSRSRLRPISGTEWAKVHFASPDFTRRNVHVVRNDDPDQVLEITLKPVRLVRASVIETPVDSPRESLGWYVYALDSTVENGYYIDAMRAKGAIWESGSIGDGSQDEPRRLQVALMAGRYRFRFCRTAWSDLSTSLFPLGTVLSNCLTSIWKLWPVLRCSASRPPRSRPLILKPNR